MMIKRLFQDYTIWRYFVPLVLFSVLVAVWSPLKAAGLAIGLGVLAVTWRHPLAAVMALLIVIPFEPFLLKFVPDEIYVYARYFSEGLIYVLALIALIRAWQQRRWPLVSAPSMLILTLVGVMIISWIANETPLLVGALGVRQIMRFILLFFIVQVLTPSREYLMRVGVAMAGVVLFQAALALLQVIIGAPLDEYLLPAQRRYFEDIQLTTGTYQYWESGQRVFGTLGRYDQLGIFLCAMLLFIVAWLYEAKASAQRYWPRLAAVLGVAALIMTYSRSAWFGFVLGFLFIALWVKRDRLVGLLTVSLLCFMGAYFIFSATVIQYLVDRPDQTVANRFLEAFSMARWRGEYYGLGRVFFYVHTPLTVVVASPFIGVGPGSYGGGTAAALHYTAVYDRLQLPFGIYGSEGHIDNNWFSIWGELGTVGLITYAAIFFALFRVALRLYRSADNEVDRTLALGFMAFVLALSFQGFLATNFEVRTIAVYFWVFAGFVMLRYAHYHRT